MQAEWRSGYPEKDGVYLVCGPSYGTEDEWGIERVEYTSPNMWTDLDGDGLDVSPRFWLSMPTSGELLLATESICSCTCGGTASVRLNQPVYQCTDYWQVRCCECDLLGPKTATRKEAIRQWNIQVFKNAFEKNKDFKPILEPLDINPAPPQEITHIQGRTFWDWLAEMPAAEREGLKVKVGTLFTAIVFFASLYAWLCIWG